MTHDSRHFDPYPLYVTRGLGPVKWDVDGNRYVDYFGGHGALILGHDHPAVMQAVHAAWTAARHFGACHELEVRWAELITQMVPVGGTGALHLLRHRGDADGAAAGARLHRASKMVHFRGHFHGWNDHMTSGHTNHFDGTANQRRGGRQSPTTCCCAIQTMSRASRDLQRPQGHRRGHPGADRRELSARCRSCRPSCGMLRDLTEPGRHDPDLRRGGNGFRVSPGGLQTAVGVTPDMTTLAKIVSGGLPGGAVVGRKEILDWLDFKVTKAAGREKIAHPGTFNANPVSAAAGIATLEILSTTDACDQGERIRRQCAREDERGAGRGEA